ncbi:DUF3037 domain-containing protein [Marinomonas sp.]|uniref:DUF3037 domain-containing protein n=1 Tax=Marinomonas sp. TaxID=1904862 RepID=UPI003BA847C3
MNTFHYSLLKCTADSKRQETVNIGIIVFKGKELDIRLLENSTKLQWFVNGIVEDCLSDITERYEFFTSHTETVEDKHKTIKSFGGPITIGGLGYFMAKSEKSYSQKINQLMMMLVEPPRTQRQTHRSMLATNIKKCFADKNLLGNKQDDILKHKVVPNYTLDEAADIKAEFMLKNGVYHLTETVDFNTQQSLPEKRRQTTDKLWTYAHAEKVLDNDVKRYFVYSANTVNESRNQGLIDLVVRDDAEIYNWESLDDQKKYIDIIEKYAHMSH